MPLDRKSGRGRNLLILCELGVENRGTGEHSPFTLVLNYWPEPTVLGRNLLAGRRDSVEKAGRFQKDRRRPGLTRDLKLFKYHPTIAFEQ
jgi:hypothetical protein